MKEIRFFRWHYVSCNLIQLDTQVYKLNKSIGEVLISEEDRSVKWISGQTVNASQHINLSNDNNYQYGMDYCLKSFWVTPMSLP